MQMCRNMCRHMCVLLHMCLDICIQMLVCMSNSMTEMLVGDEVDLCSVMTRDAARHKECITNRRCNASQEMRCITNSNHARGGSVDLEMEDPGGFDVCKDAIWPILPSIP